MRRRLHLILCAILALAPGPSALSQATSDSTWKLSGSYLNLFTRSRTVVTPARPFALDLNRLRLHADGALGGGVAIDVDYDNELLVGDYVKTPQYALMKERVETSFDLQRDYATGDAWVARHGLYRAVVTWTGKTMDVKVGRQRIPLGTGFFWSPTDLLNPIDPTRLERDYRTGADALLVGRRLGALGRISGIYAPATSRTNAIGAGYLHGNLHGADYSLLLGRFRGNDAVGADFSGSVGGLGLRGEVTATRPDSGARYARVLIGADYGFVNTLRLTGEVYYNGQGVSEPSRYDLPALLAGRTISLARWYAGLSASYEMTPLVKIATYAIVNADDGSLVLWPRVEWSVRADVDLAIGIQQFAGSARSEYGRLSHLIHGEARWFF